MLLAIFRSICQNYHGKMLKTSHIYIRNVPRFCCRFIDGIFFLWNGTESELIEFIGNFQKKTPLENWNSHIPKPA